MAKWYKDLRDRVVLLTGASRGLGRAIAHEFARHGAKQALLARSSNDLERVRGEVEAAGGTARVFPCDVTDHARVTRVVEEIAGDLGPVDVLVNNAGIGGPERVYDGAIARYEQMHAVNVVAPLHLVQCVTPGMVSRDRGYVVNVCSIAGHLPSSMMSYYSLTKFTLVGLTENLRQELCKTRVRVLEVSPGPIRTPFFEAGNLEEFGENYLFKLNTPEKVAARLVKAVRKGKKKIYVPRYSRCLPAIQSIAGRTYDKITVKMTDSAVRRETSRD